jgi:signal transduction histidine kinase
VNEEKKNWKNELYSIFAPQYISYTIASALEVEQVWTLFGTFQFWLVVSLALLISACYILERRFRDDFARQIQLQLGQSLYTAETHIQRAKERFTSNVTHELRTPLHGLLGMIHLLKQTPLDSMQEELT